MSSSAVATHSLDLGLQPGLGLRTLLPQDLPQHGTAQTDSSWEKRVKQCPPLALFLRRERLSGAFGTKNLSARASPTHRVH